MKTALGMVYYNSKGEIFHRNSGWCMNRGERFLKLDVYVVDTDTSVDEVDDDGRQETCIRAGIDDVD